MTDPTPEGVPFGRYRLRTLLGEGGMAEVYLGELRGLGDVSKILVIKRVLPHLARDPQFVTMFLDEARLASKLSHPNVVQVFDFGEEQGEYFLAMEYLPGESLHNILAQAASLHEPMPLPVTLQILTSICDGLHHAHELNEGGRSLNIVHRDVTPSNIMVTYHGNVKLLDFGVARAADRQQEKTRTGIVKGKPAYCAPEQMEGAEIDRRADIFSLGVVAYEMLTLQRLFKRETEIMTMRAVLEDPIPDVDHVRPGLPAGLGQVILRALSRRRDERYGSARDLRMAFEQFMAGAPPRLDEYMVRIFGQEKAKTAIERTLSRTIAPRSGDGSSSSRPRAAGSGSGSRSEIRQPQPMGAPPLVTQTRSVSPSHPSLLVPGALRGRKRWVLAVTAFVALVALGIGGVYLTRARVSAEAPRSGETDSQSLSPGTLRVDTVPRGAHVDVGDIRLTERSPALAKDLTPGQWVVRATLDGYSPASQTVTLEPGMNLSVLLNLEPLGRLEVMGPRRAQVEIDGRLADPDERVFRLAAGPHQLRVTLPGHQPFSRELVLQPGQDLQVRAELRRAESQSPPSDPTPPLAGETGLLDVSCVPWCRVLLNGQDVGRTSPIVGLEVPVGRHQLRMEHPPSGKQQEVTIEVLPGQRVRQRARF